MSSRILICDDSAMARKQLSRALPPDWDVVQDFAEHGREALEKIQTGGVDVMFLDLNMPVMDGYETLAAIKAADLPVIVVVVSGDVQPEAVARTRALGAYDFIKKPVSSERLEQIQADFGLFSLRSKSAPPPPPIVSSRIHPQGFDALQEVANVAMGRAASLLAQLLGVFVELPIPRINMLAPSELRMALDLAAHHETFSAVCQGLIGEGVAGEALLILHDSSYSDIAKLLHRQDGELPSVQAEMVMDIASILIGSFAKGLADQLDMTFSAGHPMVLGRHFELEELLRQQPRWRQTLAIEVGYRIEAHPIDCALLLLLTEESVPILQRKASYLEVV